MRNMLDNIAFLIKFGIIIYLSIRLMLFVNKYVKKGQFVDRLSWEEFEELCEKLKKKKITFEEFNKRIRG